MIDTFFIHFIPTRMTTSIEQSSTIRRKEKGTITLVGRVSDLNKQTRSKSKQNSK